MLLDFKKKIFYKKNCFPYLNYKKLIAFSGSLKIYQIILFHGNPGTTDCKYYFSWDLTMMLDKKPVVNEKVPVRLVSKEKGLQGEKWI